MAAGAGFACFSRHMRRKIFFCPALGWRDFVAGFYWPKCEPAPKWLRVLGVTAFVAVVAQGVLGGLRVTQLKDQLGIFHATLAQLFFPAALLHRLVPNRLLAAAARSGGKGSSSFPAFLHRHTGLILTQLILGATMRHQHAGLAIPDFPAAYGKLWPDTDPAAIARYNQKPPGSPGLQPDHRRASGIANGPSHSGVDDFCGGRPLRLARRAAGIAALADALFRSGLDWFWPRFFSAPPPFGRANPPMSPPRTWPAARFAWSPAAWPRLFPFRLLAAPVTQARRVEKNEVTSLLASSSITRQVA
jgi:hypothetical protein